MSAGRPLPLLSLSDIRSRSSYDAIIIGGGATGLVAARQLTFSGMEVLLLDAGQPRSFQRNPLQGMISASVRAVAQPFWYEIAPAWLTGLGRKALRVAGQARQPRQSGCFAWAFDPDAFIDDRDNPYETPDGDAEFAWFRSRQLNGKMTIPGHGMQYYRFSVGDLTPPAVPGNAEPPWTWPLAAYELDHWYDQVEKLLELAGEFDPKPRGGGRRLTYALPLSESEARLRSRVTELWPGATPALGVYAPWPNLLGQAAATGRLHIRQGAVVQTIDVDGAGKLKGVTWFDCEGKQAISAEAPIVFNCASTLESTRILMNSRSKEFPNGLGGDSNALGAYLMDHVLVTGQSVGPGLGPEKVSLMPGRCLHVPRVASGVAPGETIDLQLYQSSLGSNRSMLNVVSFSQMKPRAENRMTLHPTRKDRYGVPVPRIECRFSAEEQAVAQEQRRLILDLAKATGAKELMVDPLPAPAGYAMHECGTARMGVSPSSSVLDHNNTVWDVPGLYVTDGASLPTVGPHNLTLTIMALTARAASHATGHVLHAGVRAPRLAAAPAA